MERSGPLLPLLAYALMPALPSPTLNALQVPLFTSAIAIPTPGMFPLHAGAGRQLWHPVQLPAVPQQHAHQALGRPPGERVSSTGLDALVFSSALAVPAARRSWRRPLVPSCGGAQRSGWPAVCCAPANRRAACILPSSGAARHSALSPIRRGRLEEYMQLLVDSFNPAAADGLMCRDTLSVGWDGRWGLGGDWKGCRHPRWQHVARTSREAGTEPAEGGPSWGCTRAHEPLLLHTVPVS